MPEKQAHLFAVAPPGLEQMLHRELVGLGIAGARLDEGGVSFRGDRRTLYRANLHSRIASRILVRIARFRASAFHELERYASRVRWSEYLTTASRVDLRVTCRKSKLYHSDAVAERLARVIGERTGARVMEGERRNGAIEPGDSEGTAARHRVAQGGSDDEVNPKAASAAQAQLFVVRLFRDECSISADSSGAHLHMRGYREALARAPMRETLAAALIHASGWCADRPLMDPMCGAGTIPIEAALIARQVPAGLSMRDRKPRSFAFEGWQAYQAHTWDDEVRLAASRMLDRAPARLVASDRDAGAVAAALQNARRAGVQDDIELSQRALSAIDAPGETGVMLLNPPYGKRVGEERALRNLYASLGKVLRSRFSGWEVVMLSASAASEKQTALSFYSVARTSNGGIPVRIVRAFVDPAKGESNRSG